MDEKLDLKKVIRRNEIWATGALSIVVYIFYGLSNDGWSIIGIISPLIFYSILLYFLPDYIQRALNSSKIKLLDEDKQILYDIDFKHLDKQTKNQLQGNDLKEVLLRFTINAILIVDTLVVICTGDYLSGTLVENFLNAWDITF